MRAINALFALAVFAVVVGNYLPMWRAIDLARADLGIQGTWIGHKAKRITAVQPGRHQDRDLLETPSEEAEQETEEPEFKGGGGGEEM